MLRNALLIFAGLLVGGLGLMAVMPNERAGQAAVGYASVRNLVSRLPELQNVNLTMDTLRQEFTEELQSMVGEFQLKSENFQKQSAMLNDIIRESKRAELLKMERSIQEFQDKANEALSEREGELMSPLLNKVQTAIDKVSKARGYTHVFNLDAGTPLLLYAEPQFQIDSLVLLELNIK